MKTFQILHESSYSSRMRRMSSVPISKLDIEHIRYITEEHKLVQKSTKTGHLINQKYNHKPPTLHICSWGRCRHCPFPSSHSHQSHPHFSSTFTLGESSGSTAALYSPACKAKQPQFLVSSHEQTGMWWARHWAVPTVGTEEQSQSTAPLMNHSSHLKDINAQITLKRGWGSDLGWYSNLGHNNFLESWSNFLESYLDIRTPSSLLVIASWLQ